MRILLITSAYPPSIGGPSRQAVEIKEALKELGHVVKVATTTDCPEQEDVIKLTTTLKNGIAYKCLRPIQLFIQLDRIIREFRPQIIHIQVFGGPLTLISNLTARLHHIPSTTKITAERNVEVSTEKNWSNKTLKGRSLRKIAILVDQIQLALSKTIWVTTPVFKTILRQNYNIAANKILICPNFIKLEKFQETAAHQIKEKQKFTLLTTCRFRTWKGLEDGINAFNLIDNKDIKWKIIGEGSHEYRNKLKSQIEQLGLSDQIELCESLPPERIHESYKRADAYLLPSHYEPFGIVLIEAMASGLPIIATRTGGIPWVLEEGRCGILINPHSPEAIASALIRIVEEPSIAKQLQERGKDRANFFDIRNGIQILIYGYHKQLNQQNPSNLV